MLLKDDLETTLLVIVKNRLCVNSAFLVAYDFFYFDGKVVYLHLAHLYEQGQTRRCDIGVAGLETTVYTIDAGCSGTAIDCQTRGLQIQGWNLNSWMKGRFVTGVPFFNTEV